MDLTRFGERLSPRRLRLASAILALAGLILIYRGTATEAVVIVDGRAVQTMTHAQTVGAALHDAGWDLRPADRVNPEAEAHLLPGMTIRLDRADPVLLEIDGEVSTIETAEMVPANILGAAGIRLYPGDRVWSDGIRVADPARPPDRRPSRVRLETASPITLIVDGVNREFRSAAPTLGEALWEAGIRLHSADRLEPGPQTPVEGHLTATLRTSRPVVIQAEGEQLETRVAASTVGEALAQVGLAPVGLDYSVPGVDDPVPDDGQIRLVRVREQYLVEQQPLPFETSYQGIADLEIDNQRLVNPGAYGVTVHRVRVRLEDGQEVSRSVEGEWIAVEPQDRVVGYGMQIVVRSLSTPDGTLEYWRAVTMYATSYSPSRAGTSPDAPWYGITASGKPLTKGLVAIDLSLIPFGTRMYVPGYGFAEAADVGGGVRGRWIDLGYDDDNFVNWHQYVTVYFLTPVPPASNIVWIFP